MARRRRLDDALGQAAPPWIVGTLIVASAALFYLLEVHHIGVVLLALGGAGLLLLALARIGIGLLHHDDDPQQGASYVDRHRHLDDTIKSALEPAAKSFAIDSREHQFRNLLEQRALAAAHKLDTTKLAPIHLSPVYLVGVLILASAAFFLLRADRSTLPGGRSFEVALAEDQSEERSEAPTVLADGSLLEEPQELVITPEQLAQLQLRRREAGDIDAERLDSQALDSMTREELSELLRELGSESTSNTASESQDQSAQPADHPTDQTVAPDEPAKDLTAGDGLEELSRRAGEDPFTSPNGDQQQAQQSGKEPASSMAPSEDPASSNRVRRIELPPMANPNARPTEDGAPSSTATAAGAEASKELSTAEDASQSGAGGGESSGPQGSQDNPLGEGSELAVTLELALLQAQEEQERPIERSVRHRASEAQEAKVQRRGIRSVNETTLDEPLPAPVLSRSQAHRVQEYFAAKQWPKSPPL